MPYPELLAKLDAQRATGGAAWGTGEVATMAFGKLGSIVLAVAVFGAVCHRYQRLLHRHQPPAAQHVPQRHPARLVR